MTTYGSGGNVHFRGTRGDVPVAGFAGDQLILDVQMRDAPILQMSNQPFHQEGAVVVTVQKFSGARWAAISRHLCWQKRKAAACHRTIRR